MSKVATETQAEYLERLHRLRREFLGLTDWVGPDYGEKMKRGETQWAKRMAAERGEIDPESVSRNVSEVEESVSSVSKVPSSVSEICLECGGKKPGRAKFCSPACRLKAFRKEQRGKK